MIAVTTHAPLTEGMALGSVTVWLAVSLHSSDGSRRSPVPPGWPAGKCRQANASDHICAQPAMGASPLPFGCARDRAGV